MTTSDWIASVGVAMLLVAFVLNLGGWLSRDSRSYQLLNLLGAGQAGLAAAMIGFWPFVVLEGAWTLAAALALAGVGRPK